MHSFTLLMVFWLWSLFYVSVALRRTPRPLSGVWWDLYRSRQKMRWIKRMLRMDRAVRRTSARPPSKDLIK